MAYKKHLPSLAAAQELLKICSSAAKHFTCSNAQQPESFTERPSNPVLESSSTQSNLSGTGRGAAAQFVTLPRKKPDSAVGRGGAPFPELWQRLCHIPTREHRQNWALQGMQLWQRRVNIHPNGQKTTNLIDAKWLLKNWELRGCSDTATNENLIIKKPIWGKKEAKLAYLLTHLTVEF